MNQALKPVIFAAALLILAVVLGWLWISSGTEDQAEIDGRSATRVTNTVTLNSRLPAVAMAVLATVDAQAQMPTPAPEAPLPAAEQPTPPLADPPTAVPTVETPPPTAASLALPTPALEPPQQVSVNGVGYDDIIFMPPNVVARAREIYLLGQTLGRNPGAYSKVGDSTTEPPHFMTRFDVGPYNLGDYAHLQPVIDQFAGSHARNSLAGRIGMHSWTAVDPTWADKSICQPNESPVTCEIRVHNPGIVLIRLGTNDVGAAGLYDSSMRQIVETAINAGVIPVLGTKGDRHEGSDQNNQILRQIHYDYQIPLWDYDRVAVTLPGRGLDVDFAHMNTFFAHDYTDPTAFTRGHAMHNLTALMALDRVWREVLSSG